METLHVSMKVSQTTRTAVLCKLDESYYYANKPGFGKY